MKRSELQNVLCDAFPLDKYETFVDCMLARLEAITDALADDELAEHVGDEHYGLHPTDAIHKYRQAIPAKIKEGAK